MSIQLQIQALESLAATDEVLLQVETALVAESALLGDKRDHLKVLEGKLEGSRRSLHEMERTRNELMTEVRQMAVQLDKSREKMGRSRNEREVNAAQRELEEMRKLYRDRELELQRLATLIEQARTDSSSSEGEMSHISFEIGSEEGASRQRLTALQQQREQLLAQRAVAIVDVPPALFRRYETIRAKRGTGICYTTNGTCSACHISLSPMMFQTLRRTPKFEQCPSCSRILYYREPAVPSVPPGAAG